MKKKIKIFSTIASLCLAVALMAFGVYAATSISFTTTSKVTFTATDISGYWTLVIDGGDYDGTYKTGNTEKLAEALATDKQDPEQAEPVIDDIALTAEDNQVTYTITFNNTSSQVVAKVKLQHSFEDKDGYSYTVKVEGEDYTSGEVLDAAKSGSVTFVVVVTLNVEDPGFEKSEASDATLTLTGTATNK